MSIVSPSCASGKTRFPEAAVKIIRQCRDNRNEAGRATIQSKEVAVLIRAQLKAGWPRCKFSVRSDHNSVNVYWTDGPTQGLVERVIDQYSFGGFDGMIDLAYDADNWLMPDGTMEPAASCGTEGSRGCHPGYVTDCPQPGAVLVQYGPRYVFAHREMSTDRQRLIARFVEDHYGWQVDWDKPLWSQYYPNGESVPTYLRLVEGRAANLWQTYRQDETSLGFSAWCKANHNTPYTQ